MKFFNIFKNNNDDWHNPSLTFQVINEDLKKTKRETMEELEKAKVINPKALFYIHKFIDAKFSKSDFNIEGRFLEKQNTLDLLYAEGKSEVYTAISEYELVLKKLKEAEQRYKRAIVTMDPECAEKIEKNCFYDDVDVIKEKYNSLPKSLDWGDSIETQFKKENS